MPASTDRPWLRFVLLIAPALAAASACQRFDIAADAQLRCRADEECPSALRCAAPIGRCVARDSDDAFGPSLVGVDVLVDGVVDDGEAVYGAGRTLGWRFTTDEGENPLFVDDGFANPQVELRTDPDGDTSVPALARRADDAFVVDVDVDDSFGVTTVVPAVVAFDTVGNRGSFVLPGVRVDTVAPVDVSVSADVDAAGSVAGDDVFVTVNAVDDSAVSACVVVVDAGAAAPSCEDFLGLARAVPLPAGNGPKTVIAFVRDAAGNAAGPVTADVFRLDDGAVLAAPSLAAPLGQTQAKPGDAIAVSVVVTPGAAPVRSQLLTNGVARAIEIAFADVGADTFVGSFVVPADVDDGAAVVVEVIAELAGRESEAALSRSAPLTIDRTPPTVELRADDLAVSDRAVVVDVDVDGATDVVALEVEGDIDVSQSVPFRSTLAVDLRATVDGGGESREVRVVAIDDAGNKSAQASLRLRLLPDSADGTLTLRNAERPTVSGVRPRVDVEVRGVLVDAAAEVVAGSGALVYLDDAGAEVCTAPLAFVQTAATFSASAKVDGCEGALVAPTALFGRVAIAFPGAADTVRTLTTDNLYIDDEPPTGVTFAFVAEGVERNNRTSRTAGVAFVATGSDARPLTVSLGGAVTEPTAIANAPFVDGAPLIVDLDATGVPPNGEGEVFVVGELTDEVGNRVTRIVRVTIDRAPPSAPRSVEVSWRETGAPDENDPGRAAAPNIATLTMTSSVVDGADRVRVTDESGATLVALTDNFSAPFVLPRPVDAFALVAVDDAGNEADPPVLVRVPRLFLREPPLGPVGPTPVSFTLETAQAEAFASALGAPGVVVVAVNQATASCNPRVGAGPPALACTLRVLPDEAPQGRGAGLGAAVLRARFEVPRFATTVAAPVLIDTTPPALDPAAVVVDGVADRVVGAGGAVVDFAGPSNLGAEFLPRIAVTFRGVTTTVTADSSGAFAVDLGAFENDSGAEAVEIVATDVAGNVSAPVTLQNDTRRPVVTAVPERARVKGGDAITVNVNVVDASAVAVPVVTVGGVNASVTGVAPAFVASAVAPGVGGAVAVVVSVVDAAGNSASANASVVVDVDGPALSAGVGPRSNQPRAGVIANDVGGGTLASVRATVRDGATEIFNGNLGGPGGGNTFNTPDLPLIDGRSYSTTWEVVDDVGNLSTAVFTTVFDITPPSLDVIVDSSDPHETRVPFTIAVAADVDASGLFCRIDDPLLRFRSCDDPAFGFIATPGRRVVVAPGTHELAVRARDQAGNETSTVFRTFTVRPRRTLAGSDGVFCAIDDVDARMRCWGNQRGELRFDPPFTAGAVAPALVPPPQVGTRAWREVAVHDGTICALDANNAGIFCWGNNENARALRPANPPSPVAFVPYGEGVASPVVTGTFRDLVLFDRGGCVVDLNRDLRCWGVDPVGAGPPQAALSSFAVETAVVDVTAAGRVVCVRRDDGGARCFGDNSLGQGLNGSTDPLGGGAISPPPNAIITELTTSGRHTCFVNAADRTALCGGDDSAGAVTGAESFGPAAVLTSPLELPHVGPALRVIARGTRTCFLGVDGVLRCQGELAHGEVPGGGRHVSPNQSQSPAVAVEGAFFDDVIGDDATLCGVERGTARVLCVGENGGGQIDLAGAVGTNAALPAGSADSIVARGRTVCVTGFFGGDSAHACTGDAPRNRWLQGGPFRPTSDVFVVAASPVGDRFALHDDYACGVSTQNAQGLVCAGSVAAPLGRDRVPFDDFEAEDANDTSPIGSSANRIVLADDYGCASTNQGLRCWGDIPNGASSRVPTAVGSNVFADEVAAGDDHICIRQGGVRCLGSNGSNQLGLGAGGPTQRQADFVTLTQTDGANGAVDLNGGGGFGGHAIAAAGNSTCIAGFNGPVCWGANESGIAGRAATVSPGGGGDTRTFTAVPLPRRIDDWPSNTNAEVVVMARARACAVGNGQLFCWGGDSSVDPFDFVERVDDDGGYVDVAVSDDGFVCGLKGNEVRCFGDLSGGVSGTGAGFVEVATEVLP